VTEKLDDAWKMRDFPVLVEITRRIDGGTPGIDLAELARYFDFDDNTMQSAARALDRRRLVVLTGGDLTGRYSTIVDVTAEAYFLTGLHPDGDDAVTGLVSALHQAAELTSDPAEKSRLRALADAALGVSRNVLAGVLTAVITHGVGTS
jgi:hypothetical protein